MYTLIKILLSLFGKYDEESEYYGFYIGDYFFYKETYGKPLNFEVVCIINDTKNEIVYGHTKPI